MFEKTSSRTRFLLAVVLLSGLALIPISITFYLYQKISSKQSTIRNVSLITTLVGENSVAALSRQNARQAVQSLEVLKSEPGIVEACVFTSTGRVLATYTRSGQKEGFHPPEVRNDGHYEEGNQLLLFRPVGTKDARMGTIYLKADFENGVSPGLITAGTFAAGLILALFLATKFTPFVIGSPEDEVEKSSGPEDKTQNSILNLHASDPGALLKLDLSELPESSVPFTSDRSTGISDDYVDSIIGSMIDTLLVIDPSGVLNRVNKAALSLLGYTEEELIGEPLGKLLEDEEQFYMLQGLIEAGSVQEFELTYLTKHGRKIPMQCSGSVVRDLHGEIQSIVCIGKDITEQKLAQEALRESEERFRSLFQNAPIGVYRITPQGNVVNVNPAFLKMLGFFSLEEIIELESTGRSYFHEEIRSRLEKEGEIRGLELSWKKRDGTSIFVRVNARASRDSEGKTLYFEGTVEDITERRKIEQMRNEFISIVSHELRVPLTSIHGSLEWMTEKLNQELPERARRMIEIASRSSDRMVRLINDLLDIERIESGKIVFDMKVMDLCALVEHAIESNQPYAEQFEVCLDFVEAQRGIMVRVDPDRLAQVMTNLLSNAAKFSVEGGRVEVSVSQREDFARIEVRDYGTGIPEAFRPRIFQKFAQVRAANGKTKGTGLGLNITKAIVEKLGGRIGFESETDKGTTFYVEIPQFRERLDTSEETA